MTRGYGSRPERIEFDPDRPAPGEEFTITVTLDQPATEPMTLLCEKQRVRWSFGGYPELFATGPDYFATAPEKIEIETGMSEGYSTASIREDALDADGVAVVFPDHLVLTYYTDAGTVPRGEKLFVVGVVRIG